MRHIVEEYMKQCYNFKMQKPLILSHSLIVKICPVVLSLIQAFSCRFRSKGRKTRDIESPSCDKAGFEKAKLFQFKDHFATRTCLTMSLKNHSENTSSRFTTRPSVSCITYFMILHHSSQDWSLFYDSNHSLLQKYFRVMTVHVCASHVCKCTHRKNMTRSPYILTNLFEKPSFFIKLRIVNLISALGRQKLKLVKIKMKTQINNLATGVNQTQSKKKWVMQTKH